MKKRTLLLALMMTLFCHLNLGRAQEPPTADHVRLTIQPRGSNLELNWPGAVRGADGQPALPFFELQRSTDLRSWQPWGERSRARPAAAGEPLHATLPTDQTPAFYRLLTTLPRASLGLATTGEEVFGYGATFAEALHRIGPISPPEFAALFPSGAHYVPGLSWNPTTAQFTAQVVLEGRRLLLIQAQLNHRHISVGVPPAEHRPRAIVQPSFQVRLGLGVLEHVGVMPGNSGFGAGWAARVPVKAAGAIWRGRLS